MKKNVVADVMEGTLTMTKAFYKKAGVVGSREYYELRKAMKENEGFEIVFKGADKKTYKGLTFEKMADYIRTQPNSTERLIEFASVQAVAETKNAKYALTKQWFFEKYPEYKQGEVKQNETNTLIAEITKKIAEGKVEELAQFANLFALASNQ